MQAVVQDRYGGPEVLITREIERPVIATRKCSSASMPRGSTSSVTPVIERTYPLSEAAQALGHVGEGHAQGKVTVTMALRPGENSRPASASTAHSRAS